ncbi:MAG: CapA family protein, partial [bacterium]
DYGEMGLVSTIKTLDEIGVQHCGAGMNLNQAHQPAVLKVNDKTIAFFAYSMTFPVEFYAKSDSSGTAYPEPELMQCALLTWEELVDFTVVSFHWSAEKLEIPKDYQIYFAHLAIDSGADLVLGHHPHVLQGLEIYKNRLIAYSLGNFVFGSYSRHAVDSIILKAYLNEEGLFYAQCIPIIVDNRDVEFQPEIANGQRKLDILSKLQQLSLSLNQDQNIMSDTGIILGEWRAFYDDWLLDTVISTYWNIEPEKDFITGHHIKIAKQVPESQLNPSN